MIDTHCHLTYPGLTERLDEVIEAAASAGVDRMVSIGTSAEDSRLAAAVAERHPQVWATAGLHPHHAAAMRDAAELQEQLRELLDRPRVVALGEMGLDLHYDDPPLDVQRAAFGAQLELMIERPDLPGVIHNREATEATLAMLKDLGLPGERFLFHCFTGSPGEVDAILATGAMVGFTGITTFRSAANVAEASDRVPLDRLLIETDSPYLTPEPHRKVRPNEPQYVRFVAGFLAERRGMTVDEFTTAVDANAERFYRLPPK